MSSTGPTILAGPPSVIAQLSLESEAFRITTLSPARAAAGTTPTGSPSRRSRRPHARPVLRSELQAPGSKPAADPAMAWIFCGPAFPAGPVAPCVSHAATVTEDADMTNNAR